MGDFYLLDIPAKASGAIPKYAAVKWHPSDNTVTLPTGEHDTVNAIAQNEGVDGNDVTIRIYGVSPCLPSGTWSPGDWLTTADNTGKLKKAAPAVGERAPVVGDAQEPALSDDEWSFVRIAPGEVYGGATHVSTTDPTADNDGVDTAALGETFTKGALWLNTTDGGLFVCRDNATGAAVWGEITVT